MSFITASKGPIDQAQLFAGLPADTKSAKKAEYAAAGINILVSAFGDSDHPTSDGRDPVDTANTMAQFVLDNNLDGIDVDYEDFDAIGKSNGSAEQWVATFTQTLRQKLPQGQFILSHAPIAPWMAPDATKNPGGAYVKINQDVGSMIDYVSLSLGTLRASSGSIR